MVYNIEEIIAAYAHLSSQERKDLDIGRPHTFRAALLSRHKGLQSHVVIGSIKLSGFLKALIFDGEGKATLRAIGKA